MLLDSKTGETEIEFWQRQNEFDEKQLVENGNRKKELKLYCQSCCYRYPDECMDIDILHPYDRSAESCPDFIPKDYYKAKSRAKCWKKRLAVDPGYKPLPDGKLWHPYYASIIVDSELYYKIMTKEKALNFLEFKNMKFRTGKEILKEMKK